MSTRVQFDVDNLPEVRFAAMFELDDEILYQLCSESQSTLHRVSTVTRDPDVILEHDAVIANQKILTTEYNEQYQTVDVYHDRAGRQVSFLRRRTLQQPVVVLDEVQRLEDD